MNARARASGDAALDNLVAQASSTHHVDRGFGCGSAGDASESAPAEIWIEPLCAQTQVTERGCAYLSRAFDPQAAKIECLWTSLDCVEPTTDLGESEAEWFGGDPEVGSYLNRVYSLYRPKVRDAVAYCIAQPTFELYEECKEGLVVAVVQGKNF